MTVTVASFQADFPEFAGANANVIQMWINVAAQFIDPLVWTDVADYATELFVAHNVSLSPGSGATAGVGVTSVGPMAAKGAGGLSASYAIEAGTVRNAASFNLTTYGVRYAEMREMIGSGGYYSGNGVFLDGQNPPVGP